MERPNTENITEESATLFGRKILAGVARAERGVGRKAIVAMLAGRKTPGVTRHRLDRHSTFGVLGDHTDEAIAHGLKVVTNAELVCRTTGAVTANGWRVMVGDQPPKPEVLSRLMRVLRRQRRRLRKLSRALSDS